MISFEKKQAMRLKHQAVTGVVQPRAGVGPVGKEANMDHIQRVAT